MNKKEVQEYEKKMRSFAKMLGGIFSSWKSERKKSRNFFYLVSEMDENGEPMFVFCDVDGEQRPLLTSAAFCLGKDPGLIQVFGLPVFAALDCFLTAKSKGEKAEIPDETVYRAFEKLAMKYAEIKAVDLMRKTNESKE